MTPGASLSVPMYCSMAGLAKMPVIKPPQRPATPWVENTLSVSSTFIMNFIFCSLFMLSHGMMPAKTPMAIAPHAIHITGGGRDADQAGDHAVDRAEHRRLAVGELVEQRPDQKRHRGGGVGVEHRRAGVGVGEVGVAAVEAVPAQPQDAGADQRHQQAIGREVVAIGLKPRADHPGGDEAGGSRGKMDDIAAGEVRHAHLGEPAAAPQAERADGVDEGHPHRAEDHPRREVHAAEQRTGENDDGDGGEHELEEDQRRHRKGERRHARRGGRNGRLAGGEQRPTSLAPACRGRAIIAARTPCCSRTGPRRRGPTRTRRST